MFLPGYYWQTASSHNCENGVELYWDKPKEKWPRKPDGSIEMYTQSLDLNDLLRELE